MTDMTRPDVDFYTPPALDGLHRPGDILRLRPACRQNVKTDPRVASEI